MLPKSRKPPQEIEPTPPDPPAMKPPMVAVWAVEGCMRNSWPQAARAALSSSEQITPGPQITRPGEIFLISLRSARLSTRPPDKGMAWP